MCSNLWLKISKKYIWRHCFNENVKIVLKSVYEEWESFNLNWSSMGLRSYHQSEGIVAQRMSEFSGLLKNLNPEKIGLWAKFNRHVYILIPKFGGAQYIWKGRSASGSNGHTIKTNTIQYNVLPVIIMLPTVCRYSWPSHWPSARRVSLLTKRSRVWLPALPQC